MRVVTIASAGFLLMAACSLQAGQGGPSDAIHREGPFWVQTIDATENLGLVNELRVEATGNITLRGSAAPQWKYRLTRRVRARTEADARARLHNIEIHLVSHNGVAVLDLSGAPETELQVNVPQRLRSVVLNTQAGNLDVSDLDGSVRLATGAGKVSAHRVKGEVVIDTAGGLASLGDIGGLVRVDSAGGGISADVLHGGAVLQTAGGDIFVQSVAGAIRAFTAGGGIRIRDAGSAVIATTVGGPIEIVSARGTVTARNSGGPIQVGSSKGAVCESESGTIRLNDISGAVHVETLAGSVIAQLLPGRALLDSFIGTARGDITVLLPANTKLTLRAESGRPGERAITSDFPGIAIHADGGSAHGEGALNGGGPVLHLAGNGMISIKRR